MTPRDAAAAGQTFAAVPFAGLMGLHREHAADGRARVRVDDHPTRRDAAGAAGPAVLLALLDTAMASATISSVDFESTAATLDLSSSFVARRPAPLWAEARVLARDDRLVLCEAEVRDATGTLVAHGRARMRLLLHPQG